MASVVLPLVLPFFLIILLWSLQASCRTPQPQYSNYVDLPGEWQLLHDSIGISAMHVQLLHNNKVVMFDRTDFGRSNLSLPNGRCRFDAADTVLKVDCTAHSILYDVGTNTFRPLMVQTDVWCSSGAVLPDGTLIQTGGYNDGDHVVRTFRTCDDGTCDWIEYPAYLSGRRWYATNQILPDGRIIIVGGRRQFNYEFYPKASNDDPLTSSSRVFPLTFLRETRDRDENNLYPFLHLLPDGNLFLFANTRSISFNYKQNRIIREFPRIPDGNPRNYPSSGSSVLLPIDESDSVLEAEVVVCGGAPPGAFSSANRQNFMLAASTCARLKVTDSDPQWVMEEMPMARVMGDMLLLPNGDIIIINGARLGTAGWEYGRDPVMTPVIYRPSSHSFSVMCASPRPRMYHSSAVLVADGRVLVGGSNPHVYYNFTSVDYPTDLSLEAFSPPYLLAEYNPMRPRILTASEVVGYGQAFAVTYTLEDYLSTSLLRVTVAAPTFTTHSLAMNQRLVVLRLVAVQPHAADYTYTITVVGPSGAEVAPPGYYMLFVVHADIPSPGVWVKIQH